jgi:hypothetical protein
MHLCTLQAQGDDVLIALSFLHITLHIILHIAYPVQASAWLGYDMAVSRIPSSQLQSWNGSTWSQSPVGSGPPHALPPLRQGLDREHTAPPSPSSANTNSASDNSSIQKLSQQGTKGNGAAKEMSSFTAQAMLTAHYSINSAFLLNEPIIEVSATSRKISKHITQSGQLRFRLAERCLRLNDRTRMHWQIYKVPCLFVY